MLDDAEGSGSASARAPPPSITASCREKEHHWIVKIIGRMAVFPLLPERLSRLRELAWNLWWTWNPRAQVLFRAIDPQIWDETTHNAVRLLSEVSPARLSDLARDPAFLAEYDAVLEALDAYLAGAGQAWFQREHGHQLPEPIAYFSAEFGLHESLPIYSGGLGILAGDHCKEASDLGLPFVGIGFLYPQGFFRQRITRTGDQEAIYDRLNFADLPATLALTSQGDEVRISVELNGRRVFARIWTFQIGRNPLYLLDTDVPENDPRDRVLSARLYGGDTEMRIAQEIMLGIGGVRAVRAMGMMPSVWHLNEGHAAFSSLERIRELVEGRHLTFAEAVEAAASKTVFTTHTPVPAGNDAFPYDLIDRGFHDFWPRLGLSRDEFVEFARQDQSWGPSFSMTVLALKTSSRRNGVSRLHGAVSRKLWQFLWPTLDVGDVPITSVTNGVHTPTWCAPALAALYARYLGEAWMARIDDTAMWEGVLDIPDEELWNVHRLLKDDLIAFARQRARARSERLGEGVRIDGPPLLVPQAFTIGFARRFATYKRATLLFRDRQRLLRILNTPGRPVQIVFAGKAHPADEPGKALLRQIEQYARDPDFAGKVVLLEEYDMDMARHMVAGVDLWLNTPIRPHEASGTSGQKAALNGVPSCSILDGWWPEAYDGTNGWAIGEDREYADPNIRDDDDAAALYMLLEHQIIPTFFDADGDGVPHAWVRVMKEAICTVAPRFSMSRMVKEYVERLYLPAAELGRLAASEDFAVARDLAAWKAHVRALWPSVTIEAHGPHDGQLTIDNGIDITALVGLGDLSPRDVAVELVWGNDSAGQLRMPVVVRMSEGDLAPDGRHVFRGRLVPDRNGALIYGVRVRPDHPALAEPNDVGLVLWAQ
jgi:starch phosphorylase